MKLLGNFELSKKMKLGLFTVFLTLFAIHQVVSENYYQQFLGELKIQLWGTEFDLLLNNITNQMRLSYQDPNIECSYKIQINDSFYLVRQEEYNQYKDLTRYKEEQILPKNLYFLERLSTFGFPMSLDRGHTEDLISPLELRVSWLDAFEEQVLRTRIRSRQIKCFKKLEEKLYIYKQKKPCHFD
jgi:hypothetical protein